MKLCLKFIETKTIVLQGSIVKDTDRAEDQE